MTCFRQKCILMALVVLVFETPVDAAVTWIYTPESVSSIEGRVYADEGCPVDLLNMSTYGMTSNALSQTISSWNLGSYTGVTSPSPLANYQRGINDSQPGSSAVQMAGTQVGAILKTASIPGGSSYNYNLANAQVKYAWSVETSMQPWTHDSSQLNMSFDMKIPQASASGGACGYTCVSLLVSAGGKILWLQPQILDTRGAPSIEYVGWDVGTNSGYANTYFDAGDATRYAALLPGSNESTGSAWSDWRHFSFSISKEQLLNAVGDINNAFHVGLSTNPEDFSLGLMTIQEEVYWPTGSTVMSMGIDNITMWETYTTTPEPGALALLLCGLPSLAIFVWRRRRRR